MDAEALDYLLRIISDYNFEWCFDDSLLLWARDILRMHVKAWLHLIKNTVESYVESVN